MWLRVAFKMGSLRSTGTARSGPEVRGIRLERRSPQAAARALRLLLIYGVVTIDRRHAVWQRFHHDKSPDGYLRAIREHDVGDFGIRQDIGNPVPDQSVFDEAHEILIGLAKPIHETRGWLPPAILAD